MRNFHSELLIVFCVIIVSGYGIHSLLKQDVRNDQAVVLYDTLEESSVDTKKNDDKKHKLCLNKTASGEYTEYLEALAREKCYLQNEIATLTGADSVFYSGVAKLFEAYLVDSIIPFWYGTSYDFNGHTNVPGKGKVACGYLVSTSLKHAGVNVNRFKLAQQAASDIVDALNSGKKPRIYRNVSVLEVQQDFLENEADGLYVLGLDYHVGFLLKRSDSLYFIHADYFSGAVAAELFEESYAAEGSQIFYIGELSTNYEFLRKWIKNEPIHI